MKKWFGLFIVLIVASNCVPQVQALSSCAKTFQDLQNTDAQYIPAVGCLNQQYCVVAGTTDGRLLASTPITRGEAVAFVVRYHTQVLGDWTLVDPGTPSFSDVPRTHPLFKEIETSKARGFILGYGDGRFGAEDAWTYGYQGPNRSDYNFSLTPADQQTRGGFLKSMYDRGTGNGQLSACILTLCSNTCNSTNGCQKARSFYSSTPDCKTPVQQPVYDVNTSCGPIPGGNNSSCPVATNTPIPPTATPTPTAVPPTATPTPVPSTTFSFTLALHAIGNSGDNVNASGVGSNKNPLTKTRSIQVSMFNANNDQVFATTANVTYASSSGTFIGSKIVGPADNFTLPPGYYTLRVKTDRYLRKQTGIIQITPGATIVIPQLTLIAGDSNNDNLVNILDYNMIADCYSDFLPANACNDGVKKLMTDLTDDGKVNQFDYNLLLRELGVQAGSE